MTTNADEAMVADARRVQICTYVRDDVRRKLEDVARAEGLGVAPFLRRTILQIIRSNERFAAEGARAR